MISPLLGEPAIERQAEFSAFELSLVTKQTGQGCVTLKIPSIIWGWSNGKKRRDGRHKVPFQSSKIKTYLHPLAESLWAINRPLGTSHMIQHAALNSLSLIHSWFETVLRILLQSVCFPFKKHNSHPSVTLHTCKLGMVKSLSFNHSAL